MTTASPIITPEVTLFMQVQYSGKVYRFCSATSPVNANGQVWDAIQFQVGAIRQTGSNESEGVQLNFPVYDQNNNYIPWIADLMSQYPPVSGVSVFFYTRLSPTTPLIARWRGRVVSMSITSNEATLSLTSAIGNLRRATLSQYWSRECCQWSFGSSECAAVAGQVSKQVVSITGGNIEVGGNLTDGMKPPADYSNLIKHGSVSQGAQVYRIIEAYGNRCRVIGYPDFAVGSWIILRSGCDKLYRTCRDIYRVGANYGAQPYIPYNNPTEDGNFN